jgi:translation initiation factor IF-3
LSNVRTRINHQIKSPEVRVIGPAGENYGVLPISEALARAHEAGLDLIEYSYEESKKQKAQKAKAHTIEIKTVQVKIGTGEHDLELKAKKASEWLKEGHRIKIDLFLPGRSKYMDPKFLEERLARLLTFVTENYKIAEKPQKSPKGLTTIIERA